ncbi:MAG: zf-HC2 domain-containing protein [Proteobacteria bacterium]|nr:zf-HC2 domain-containing protein [Pseudomonadota bacterium]
MTKQRQVDQHIGELLSGLLDGELTQQQRQMVKLHCEGCAECSENLESLRVLRKRIGDAALSEVGEDKWREHMNDKRVETPRSIGWILFIGGLLVVAGIAVSAFLFSDEIHIGMKFLIIAIYGGLATLLYSVLRQRLIERKTDKYKDVEI